MAIRGQWRTMSGEDAGQILLRAKKDTHTLAREQENLLGVSEWEKKLKAISWTLWWVPAQNHLTSHLMYILRALYRGILASWIHHDFAVIMHRHCLAPHLPFLPEVAYQGHLPPFNITFWWERCRKDRGSSPCLQLLPSTKFHLGCVWAILLKAP